MSTSQNLDPTILIEPSAKAQNLDVSAKNTAETSPIPPALAEKLQAAMPSPEAILQQAQIDAHNREVELKKSEKRLRQESRRAAGVDYRSLKKRRNAR